MSQFQKNCDILQKYIPEGAVKVIAGWIIRDDFKLRITRARHTKLGDYRSPIDGGNHKISINYNLNKFSFLITLVHEIAHLHTFNKFGMRAAPHGQEWKSEYIRLMEGFLHPDIFPTDIMVALQSHLNAPTAASCSDLELQRVLKRHDVGALQKSLIFLEQLPDGSFFKNEGGKYFKKGNRVRTRFRCTDLSGKHIYLFHPLAEVQPVAENSIVREPEK